MACRELVEIVTDYLEGRLPEGDRRGLEQHLQECPDCVQYIEQVRQMITALGELSEESLGPATRQELLQAFRGWRDRQSTTGDEGVHPGRASKRRAFRSG